MNVKNCPKLNQHPYNLASEGICGRPRLADVGGVPYLVPGPAKWQERVYDLKQVCQQVDLPDGFILGASACSKHVIGRNAELMPNLKNGNGNSTKFNNNTHVAKMLDGEDVPITDNHICEKYNSTEFTLLGNLFISEGKSGEPVVFVKVKNRIGTEKSLVTCMQKGLNDHFKSDQDPENKTIGLGGCFISLNKTKTKIHIMPDFSKKLLIRIVFQSHDKSNIYDESVLTEWIE